MFICMHISRVRVVLGGCPIERMSKRPAEHRPKSCSEGLKRSGKVSAVMRMMDAHCSSALARISLSFGEMKGETSTVPRDALSSHSRVFSVTASGESLRLIFTASLSGLRSRKRLP